ncbi:hypothetical protein [Pseudomonas savastanoi]|uniref:hypothetical protein n=1 Tax=Pseudomonas savastanoi TaxID=29438 RepID=UPI000E3254EB|nr:hypothetical protein [Pseudomonas savastanoi]
MSAEQDAAARVLLEIFADALEQSHGPCMAGRAALMGWIDDQFLRLARLDVPDQMAGPMIHTAYLDWQAKAVGLSNNPD